MVKCHVTPAGACANGRVIFDSACSALLFVPRRPTKWGNGKARIIEFLKKILPATNNDFGQKVGFFAPMREFGNGIGMPYGDLMSAVVGLRNV